MSNTPVFGTEGGVVEIVHNAQRPLYANGNIYPSGTIVGVREWADVSLPAIGCTRTDLRVQVHRDGTCIRTSFNQSQWNVSTGSRARYNAGVESHHFFIDRKKHVSARIVCIAFWGSPPENRTLALHAVRRTEGAETNDSAQNVAWGSFKENAADKISDKMSRFGGKGRSISILGRPEAAHLQASEWTLEASNTIALDVIDDKLTTWSRFASTAAAATQLNITAPHISQVLRGKGRLAKGWHFKWDTKTAFDATTMRFLDVFHKKKERRFVRNDGRLFVEKNSNGVVSFVEQHLRPRIDTGYVPIFTNSEIADINGFTKMHRVVARLFLDREIAEKTAATGLRFSNLVINHINEDRGDNRLVNLEVVTQAENTQASVNGRNQKRRKLDSTT